MTDNIDSMISSSTSSSIPWNDINILVVTDVHSWIGSHERHTTSTTSRSVVDEDYDNYDDNQVNTHSKMDADYGDILSFYQRLQQELNDLNDQDEDETTTEFINDNNNNKIKKKKNRRRELFFVMNGDFMDGTVRVCDTTIFFSFLLYFSFPIRTHTRHASLSFRLAFLPFLFSIYPNTLICKLGFVNCTTNIFNTVITTYAI